MKKLSVTNTVNTEFQELLQSEFIEPLKALGFTFLGYSHSSNDEYCQGVHQLLFDGEAKDITHIENLMYRDDNQPKTQFNYYLGALWIYIPYCG